MNRQPASMIARRRYEQARPRHQVDIDRDLYTDYVGHYQLESGAIISVTHRGDHLFVKMAGQFEVEACAEAHDAFCLKSVSAQLVFLHQAAGDVDRVIVHHNGCELKAVRIDDATAMTLELEQIRRIRDQVPIPGSEFVLRRLIAECRDRKADYGRMTPPMADSFATRLKGFGRTSLVSEICHGLCSRVLARMVGIYHASFEEGDTEWSLALSPEGKLSALLVRPLPISDGRRLA